MHKLVPCGMQVELCPLLLHLQQGPDLRTVIAFRRDVLTGIHQGAAGFAGDWALLAPGDTGITSAEF